MCGHHHHRHHDSHLHTSTHSCPHARSHTHHHPGGQSPLHHNFPHSEGPSTYDCGCNSSPSYGGSFHHSKHHYDTGMRNAPGLAPRGFHWLGLGVLATTLIRKGKGESAFWFGLGAIVTGIFVKHRLARIERYSDVDGEYRRFGWGRRFGGRKNAGWKITVTADPTGESEEETDNEKDEECQQCAKRSDNVSGGRPNERPEEPAFFDAPLNAKRNSTGDAADIKVDEMGRNQATSLEARLDSIAGSIEDLKTHLASARSRASSISSSGLDLGAAFVESAQDAAPF